jgi:hypothetical protein
LSLRVDGAVDKQRIDNKHVMAKCVSTSGDPKTVYLGFSESEERGNVGLHCALQAGASKCGIPWTTLFAKTTSIVTDGASENTGEYHSLWKRLSEERISGKEHSLPLIKIWCGVHRSQLAFKDMTINVPEVPHLVRDCKAVTAFYNVSAVRTKEIKLVAAESKTSFTQFPSVKDIRFTEYSYTLLSSVLSNYKPMIIHLQKRVSDPEAEGILNKWRDADTVQCAAVLCDALYLYKRFQKQIQGDQITVFDLESTRDHCVTGLKKLMGRCLPGGYEEMLKTNDEVATFCDLKLHRRQSRAATRKHLFVTTKGRDVTAIKSEILQSLCNFLTSRLAVDDMPPEKASKGQSYATQFKSLSPACMKAADATEEEIQTAFLAVVPDLDRREFFAAYAEILLLLKSTHLRSATLNDILKVSLANNEWRVISVALARILVAKPHSCDVERLISAYNVIKDDDRCSLAANTIDAYLHVHINMPVLSDFDVRPAVRAWFAKLDRRSRPTKKATEQEWFAYVFGKWTEETIYFDLIE